jgi:hypothetical protein
MTLDIDVDALRRERSEIKKRLLRIESLLELANHSNPTPVPKEAIDKAISIWHKELERINTSPTPAPQEVVDKAASIWADKERWAIKQADQALLKQADQALRTSPIPPALMGALNSVPLTTRPARSFKQGVRRDVLMALSTGSSSELELTKVLTQWKAYQVVVTVRDLLNRKMAYLTEHGQIQLSDSGKSEAKWFIVNPLYRVHRRSH